MSIMQRMRARKQCTSQKDANGLSPLSDLQSGQQGQVGQLCGGHALVNRMVSLGFTPGTEVVVLQNYGRGPLIVRVREARVALGRREAGQVLVKAG